MVKLYWVELFVLTAVAACQPTASSTTKHPVSKKQERSLSRTVFAFAPHTLTTPFSNLEFTEAFIKEKGISKIRITNSSKSEKGLSPTNRKEVLIYNKNGKLLSSTSFENGKPQRSKVNIYANGLLTKTVTMSDFQGRNETQYAYDDSKRLTEELRKNETVTYVHAPSQTTKRTIGYGVERVEVKDVTKGKISRNTITRNGEPLITINYFYSERLAKIVATGAENPDILQFTYNSDFTIKSLTFFEGPKHIYTRNYSVDKEGFVEKIDMTSLVPAMGSGDVRYFEYTFADGPVRFPRPQIDWEKRLAAEKKSLLKKKLANIHQ